MKIALAQLNFHIGNFEENTTKIAFNIKKAQQQDCDLVVFSELAICGYPPLDLLESKEFVQRCENEIALIARICTNIGVLIGGPSVNTDDSGKRLFNSAYFLYEGKIKQVYHKTLLPTYDVFDEYRYFEPNTNFGLLEFKDKKIAVTICEDIWYTQPVDNDFGRSNLYKQSPLHELMPLNPDLIVNLAASPFSHTHVNAKKSIFIHNALDNSTPLINVNQTGAHAELIFDGASRVINERGEIIKQLAWFAEDFDIIELESLHVSKPIIDQDAPNAIGLIYKALVIGIRDYFHKSNFTSAVLGLSGGLDSAVVLALAVEALGNDNVYALLLPSAYSSDHSITDAKKIAENLNILYDIIPINDIFGDVNKSLEDIFRDQNEDVTEENIQSRIRSILLMAVSNKFGHILLNTSNKSEAAVGYGTLYGDMAGGLSVLGDVYKTDVYKLAAYINREKEIIPNHTIIKPPSAELKPNQKDSDTLPDYDVMDKILFQYIEQQLSSTEIAQNGFDKLLVDKIISMVNRNEYKRFQSPPILRISSKAFGGGRRMPLVAKY